MKTRIRLAGALALLTSMTSLDSARAQQHANANRGSRLVVPPHAGNAHASMARSSVNQGNGVAMQQMRQQMQANHQAMMMQQQQILSSQMSRHNRIQKQHQIQAARLSHSSTASNASKTAPNAVASTQTVSTTNGTHPATTAAASATAPTTKAATSATTAANTTATTTSAGQTATGSTAKSVPPTTNPLGTTVTPATKTTTAATTPATTTTGTPSTATPSTTPTVTAGTTATPAVAATTTPSVLGTTGRNRGVSTGVRPGMAGLYASNFGQSPSIQGSQSLVLQLNNAYSTLANADHDYQGHRVRAMNHIHSALRHLGMSATTLSGMGIAQNAGVGGAGLNAGGTGRLPQAQSDTALRQAIGYLRNAQMHVNNGGLGGAGNMAMTGPAAAGGMAARFGTQRISQNVHGSIVMAVRELEVALSVR